MSGSATTATGTSSPLNLLKVYEDFFTNHSWPDVTSHINIPTGFFGEEGNRINILFYRADPDVDGYFRDKDFYTDECLPAGWHSSKTNIFCFYLNIDAAANTENGPPMRRPSRRAR